MIERERSRTLRNIDEKVPQGMQKLAWALVHDAREQSRRAWEAVNEHCASHGCAWVAGRHGASGADLSKNLGGGVPECTRP